MRTLSISVIAGLVLLLAALAVPAMAFNTPIEITAPGVYTLDADVLNSGSTAFVVIKSNDVTIDGQGHLLDGRDTSTSKAIVVERYIENNVWYTPTNIEIKNLKLRDWGIGISDYLGQITVSNVAFRSNKQGILFKTIHTGAVYDSLFADNFEAIKTLFDNNMVIHGCTFTNNYWGIYTVDSNNAEVEECTFNGNTFGIRTQLTTNFEFEELKFTQNYFGLYLMSSSAGAVYDSVFDGNTIGDHVGDASSGILFYQNIFKNSGTVGVFLDAGVNACRFWDNKFNNWHNVQFSPAVGPNKWISPGADAIDEPQYGAGPNIIGRMVIGGNFWAQPDLMGWSQITYDVADVYGNVGHDDICDWPFEMTPTNVDEFPLHM